MFEMSSDTLEILGNMIDGEIDHWFKFTQHFGSNLYINWYKIKTFVKSFLYPPPRRETEVKITECFEKRFGYVLSSITVYLES